MTDEQLAFIREIVAQPDDLVPRLVYADWLEERGNPQGEFIRVQCELESAREPNRRQALRQREAALLAEHRATWLRPLGKNLLRGVFRRGLLEQVEVRPRALRLPRARKWLVQFPILSLQAQISPQAIGNFNSIAELRQLHSLRLSNSPLGDGACIRLLNKAPLDSIQELWLTSTRITAHTVRWLVQSPLAGQLKSLILSGNVLETAGGEALIAAPPLPRLEALYLSSCGIDRRFLRQMKSRHPKLAFISHP